jgi:hypothetical protein
MARPSRRRVVLLGLLACAALASVAHASDCPPAPEPDPGGPHAGFGGAVYVTRDAVSCRILLSQFGFNVATNLYEFWWAEGSMDAIREIAAQGTPVVFVDSAMTTPPVRIVEYHHAGLDHYFMTAEGAEAGVVDAGAAGIGWTRTGLGFTAWKLDPAVAQTISVDLCRFYGSPTIGPNSHFYTAAGAECEQLKALAASAGPLEPKWNYEGPAFRVERGLARDGGCLAGTISVLRLFNGGAARGLDPNHRYTTRQDVADAMVREGWILEGRAFCARP